MLFIKWNYLLSVKVIHLVREFDILNKTILSDLFSTIININIHYSSDRGRARMVLSVLGYRFKRYLYMGRTGNCSIKILES